MADRKVIVVLQEPDIQNVERAVLGRDVAAPVTSVERVIQRGIRKAYNKRHCRPVFEWETGDIGAVRPAQKNRLDQPNDKDDDF